jgi:hypothetical protein
VASKRRRGRRWGGSDQPRAQAGRQGGKRKHTCSELQPSRGSLNQRHRQHALVATLGEVGVHSERILNESRTSVVHHHFAHRHDVRGLVKARGVADLVPTIRVSTQ